MIQPSIIVHSGAGYFPDERNASKLEVTRSAAVVGWETLLRQDNVLDAVEAAVRVMEDNVECNAGQSGQSLAYNKQNEMYQKKYVLYKKPRNIFGCWPQTVWVFCDYACGVYI